MTTGPAPRRNGLLIGLSIAFSVLALTTLGFGAATIVLLVSTEAAASAPAPSPTPASTTGHESATIDGFEISSASDFAVERFALAVQSYASNASIYAFLTNESHSHAANAFFDVTTYREDGSIVERGLDIVHFLPGETGVLEVGLPDDLSEAASIVIEQTGIDWLTPAITGGATVDSIEETGLEDLLEVKLTSTLSQPTENVDVYVVARVDDELVGICKVWADIPADGSPFDDLCDWAPTPRDDPVMADALPADVEFDAYVRLEAPETE